MRDQILAVQLLLGFTVPGDRAQDWFIKRGAGGHADTIIHVLGELLGLASYFLSVVLGPDAPGI